MNENFENPNENNQINSSDGQKDIENINTTEEKSMESNVINLPGNNNNNNEANRNDNEVNRFSMNENGDIRAQAGGTAAISGTSRLFVILGWVSAALTFLISPLFAIAGIIFGVLVNRSSRGKGNVIIITNIVLAVLGVIVGALGIMFGNIFRY